MTARVGKKKTTIYDVAAAVEASVSTVSLVLNGDWSRYRIKEETSERILKTARELGYSGVALKACKGHSGALLMGAAAQKYGMFLCVQDLTCPGASFLHSASLAARILGVAAIEGNARQYCPAGNEGWSERYPGMFQITDGTLGTRVLNGPGLGF